MIAEWLKQAPFIDKYVPGVLKDLDKAQCTSQQFLLFENDKGTVFAMAASITAGLTSLGPEWNTSIFRHAAIQEWAHNRGLFYKGEMSVAVNSSAYKLYDSRFDPSWIPKDFPNGRYMGYDTHAHGHILFPYNTVVKQENKDG